MTIPQTSSGTAYAIARERYAELGVDTEAALSALEAFPISLQCWQGDDVQGFERAGAALGGGLAVTGNYPGRARSADELRADFEVALEVIPGRHRVNLHAIYGEFGGRPPERDEIEPPHFAAWIEWAAARGLGLDFNPTCFAHPKAADGFTLAHRDSGIRGYWVRHCRQARMIAAAFGRALRSPSVCNVWIPDGFKDTPADRDTPRQRLAEALDEVFAEPLPNAEMLDSVEPKLFGIGSESYVAGSHEFYLGYAVTRQKWLCLDAGHFHPTESVADKISAVMPFVPGLLLHVSRGVRWDSDHVVTSTDELHAIAREAARHRDCVRIGMDYFDATINRVAAWVIGARNVQRAILASLLEPAERLAIAEDEGDFTARLALQEEAKAMPVSAVWDEYCARQDVPIGAVWLEEIRRYEREALLQRS